MRRISFLSSAVQYLAFLLACLLVISHLTKGAATREVPADPVVLSDEALAVNR